jgi:hypothetical protein
LLVTTPILVLRRFRVSVAVFVLSAINNELLTFSCL